MTEDDEFEIGPDVYRFNEDGTVSLTPEQLGSILSAVANCATLAITAANMAVALDAQDDDRVMALHQRIESVSSSVISKLELLTGQKNSNP